MQRPNKRFKGVIVPMITPLTENLLIDTQATEKILLTFLKAGASPFLLGTTGESVSISGPQKYLLVKTTTLYLNSKVKVYAGISGNCLQESIDNGKQYADIGVDAVVAHLPFYYPLSNSQMLTYCEKLADALPCPLILYNNPIITHYSIPLDVIDRLSYHPNIHGVKDSERGMERLDQAIGLWAGRPDFAHLVGWAAQSAYALLKGSDGIVPSTGNLTPLLYNRLYQAALNNDPEKALKLQETTDEISGIYQKDRNLSQSLPALKVMMASQGLCKPYVLPPLNTLDETDQQSIKEKTTAILAEIM